MMKNEETRNTTVSKIKCLLQVVGPVEVVGREAGHAELEGGEVGVR